VLSVKIHQQHPLKLNVEKSPRTIVPVALIHSYEYKFSNCNVIQATGAVVPEPDVTN
jgi:hypothetical protein